jgi:hypothetical protein
MKPNCKTALAAIRAGVLASLLIACALIAASPAFALGTPGTTEAAWWQLDSRTAPKLLPASGSGVIEASATNLGDAGVSGTPGKPLKLVDVLPAGLEVTTLHALVGTKVNELLPALLNCKLEPIAGGGQECAAKEGKCTVLPATSGGTTVECSVEEGTLEPYEVFEVRLLVKTLSDPSPAGSKNEVRVEGGEAVTGPHDETKLGPPIEAPPRTSTIEVGSAETPFGVERYELAAEDETGAPDVQAGSHPFQMTTTLNLDQTFEELTARHGDVPSVFAQPKNLHFVLPAGLLGNTTAVPQCPDGDFSTLLEDNVNLCKPETAIGVAAVTFNEPTFEPETNEDVPVFNLVPAPGEPARLGFEVDRVPIYLDTSVLTGKNYAVEVTVHDTSTTALLLKSVVSVWGEPGDVRHDRVRGWGCISAGRLARQGIEKCEPPAERPTEPFLRMPTSCSTELETSLSGESWPVGQSRTDLPLQTEGHGVQKLGLLEGCEQLPFGPSISVQPTESNASSPTGLNVVLETPQSSLREPGALSEADLRENTVALPAELQANAGAANGLQTCSAAQMGFEGLGKGLPESAQTVDNEEFSAEVPPCPEAAKIGTVNIKTPLLPEEIVGSVYMATQNADPFISPLAIYIVAQAPVSKVLVKLAGAVNIGANGQLVTTFRNTPQAPFERFELHLFSGPRASQATPAFCGTYSGEASFKPWGEEAAPATKLKPSFAITHGVGGGSCPGEHLSFSPGYGDSLSSHQAGAFTAFTTTIKHPDGQQALEKIELTTPPGLAAVLASVPLCPNPQSIPLQTPPKSHGEVPAPPCPAASQIGETTSVSGLGGDPVELKGELFLTEGYGGAPFGLLAVTDAKAGPFNLGLVNVRSQIFVNKTTTAATIVSEQIPKMVQGVPTQLKELTVKVNRPGFEFNPTNCETLKVTGALAGYEGGKEGLSTPLNVEGCGSLPFAPKLTSSVAGHGSKEDGTEFKVTIESPGLGQANIHKVDLTIPALLPSRLTTIQKACLAATFEANPASCDEGSVIGEGIVHTPVFKNPLRGPAYLVSHGAAEFPDVEFVLQGEGVTVLLDGKTDIKNKVTYSKFETSPDAPFTKFESIFPAGPHSALTPNVPESEDYDLCKHTLTVPTEITGQNGAFISQTTPVKIEGCGGVLPTTTFKAKIKKHSIKGSTLTLVVEVPTSGHLTISGSGLRTLKKTIAKKGTYTLKLHLGPKAAAAVAHKHPVKVRVSVNLAPTKGKGLPAVLTVKFP